MRTARPAMRSRTTAARRAELIAARAAGARAANALRDVSVSRETARGLPGIGKPRICRRANGRRVRPASGLGAAPSWGQVAAARPCGRARLPDVSRETADSAGWRAAGLPLKRRAPPRRGATTRLQPAPGTPGARARDDLSARGARGGPASRRCGADATNRSRQRDVSRETCTALRAPTGRSQGDRSAHTVSRHVGRSD